jgi:hypothetical protein
VQYALITELEDPKPRASALLAFFRIVSIGRPHGERSGQVPGHPGGSIVTNPDEIESRSSKQRKDHDRVNSDEPPTEPPSHMRTENSASPEGKST